MRTMKGLLEAGDFIGKIINSQVCSEITYLITVVYLIYMLLHIIIVITYNEFNIYFLICSNLRKKNMALMKLMKFVKNGPLA